MALRELVDKPLWREKFGITAEMVEPFAVVPIIGKLKASNMHVMLYLHFDIYDCEG